MRVRIITFTFLILFLMSGSVAGYTWPDGWSLPVSDLGHSRAGFEYLKVMEDGKVYSLEIDDSAQVIYLVTLDLESKERVAELEVGRIQGQVRGIDMAIGNGIVDIAWIENRNNHVILNVTVDIHSSTVLEMKEVYSSSRPLRQVAVTTGESRIVLWSELRERFTMMWADLNEPVAQVLIETEGPALPRQIEVDASGDVHLLWYIDQPSLDRRILYYSWFSSGLEEQERHELGNIGIHEILSGTLVLEAEKAHLIWGLPGRVTDSVRMLPELRIGYAQFYKGEPIVQPFALSNEDFWRMERPDIFISNGSIELVWASGLDGNTEIYHGRIQDNEIIDVTRLTWTTHHYTVPRVFNWQGYSYVFYQRLTENNRLLYLIENKNPEIPGVLHRLGIDSENIFGSGLYKIGSVFAMSALATIFGVIPIGLTTLALFLLHKKLIGYPRTAKGLISSLLMVCIIMFLQMIKPI